MKYHLNVLAATYRVFQRIAAESAAGMPSAELKVTGIAWMAGKA